MRQSKKGIEILALGCALWSPLFGQIAQAQSSDLTVTEVANTDGERAGYVRRALLPYHPSNVEGLRLTATGTGFFVTSKLVLTNFHVVGNCRGLTVGNNTEAQELPAILAGADQSLDLAILGANDPNARPARFKTDFRQETDGSFAVVGYPEHGLPVLQAELQPVVASPDDLRTNRRGFPFSGAVRRGNSGSPVLDNSGAVQGMVRAKIDTPGVYRATGEVVDNIGFAIANSTIIGFLNAHDVSFEPAVQTPPLSSDQLLQKAHQFVRQIGCWN